MNTESGREALKCKNCGAENDVDAIVDKITEATTSTTLEEASCCWYCGNSLITRNQNETPS